MPANITPIADLARMYRERIPTSPTKSIGRMGPVSVGRGGLSLNPLPALGSVVRWLRDQPGTNVSTPVNVGGGVSMGGQGGASQLIFDPTARAVERAVGDVTAIPGIGEPSPSYTAEQIRQQGVIPGVLGAAMDYSMFLPGAIKAVRGVRGATADAAERLAQNMASREMGIATNALPERPMLTMKPTTPRSTNVDALQQFIEGKRATEVPPSSQFNTPEVSLSQRDMDLLRYNPLDNTPTADQLARNLEAMSKNQNPVTTRVDWAVTDPSKDVDLTRMFRSELDAQMASPEAATIWTAQSTAKQGVNDYLIRNGLQSQLIQNAPSYVNLRTLPNYISTLDWSSLMRAVPQLKNYYVDVMRSYGIGL